MEGSYAQASEEGRPCGLVPSGVVGVRASQAGLEALADVTAVLGGAAEATLGTGGILAALGALADSRALDTNTLGLGAAGTTGHRTSGSHFIQRIRKNTNAPLAALSS